ncbi:hypothetical protein TWF106_000157, partial [Orbilia oligospora]
SRLEFERLSNPNGTHWEAENMQNYLNLKIVPVPERCSGHKCGQPRDTAMR